MIKRNYIKITAVLLIAVCFLCACGKNGLKEQEIAEQTGAELAEEPSHQDIQTGQDIQKDPNGEENRNVQSIPEYVRGSLGELEYENDFLKLGYHLPAHMIFLSEQEIQEAMSVTGEAFAGESGENPAQEGAAFNDCEMMCLNADATVNLLLTVEDQPGETATEQDCAKRIETSVLDAGIFQDAVVESGNTVEIAGSDYWLLKLAGENGEMTICQDYYLRLTEGKLVTIVLSYEKDAAQEAAEALEGFYLKN